MTTLPATALQRAIAFLRTVLADGPLLVKEVEELALEAGVSRRTVKRARAKLGVESRPDGFGGPRVLALPEGASSVDQVSASVDHTEDQRDESEGHAKAETERAPTASMARTDVPSADRERRGPPARSGVRRVRLNRIR
jgi:hypothetical protein